MQGVDSNSKHNGEGIVKVLKTEQMGEVYIRADGKRVRRVKKTVIKRRKKPKKLNNGFEETVYIRESDGKRVRRITKIIRRTRRKSMALTGC